MSVDTTQYFGLTDPSTPFSKYNELRFAISQQLLKLNTSMPVEVVSVSAAGVAPVGLVSVRILVSQVTGGNATIPHAVIPNVPYFRLQGGANAVIIDPQVGDIGMASFCSRDITAVKNAKRPSPPGSKRSYDFSDALYTGGFLNGTPAQYIHFTEGGIIVRSPNSVTVEAPSIVAKASASAIVESPSVVLGAGSGAAMRALVDDRIIAVYNGHSHPSNGSAPTQQISSTSSVSTSATKAN